MAMASLAVFNFTDAARPALVNLFNYCEIHATPFLPQ